MSDTAPTPPQKKQILTATEIIARNQSNLLTDDDYTTELRLQVAHLGENILSRTQYEVEILEREFVALSQMFNEFLDEVKTLDQKIGDLSTSINQGKLQAAQELDKTIKQEVQTIVEQLRVLPKADLDGVEVLYQNLDALQDNYAVLQLQLQTLDEIGIKTEPLKQQLPALEKGLQNFGSAIEERQMKLLVGETEEEKVDYEGLRSEIIQMIQAQHRAMIKHLHQAQTLVDPNAVSLLQRNQKGFEKSLDKIQDQLKSIANAGLDVSQVEEMIDPLARGLKQFERALSSNHFLQITQRIHAEIQLTQEQIEEAQNCNDMGDWEILNENIEVLYENCDAFADEIETLEEQGVEINGLVEHYDVLRVTIEQFERIVQDAANRIGLSQGNAMSGS